MSEIEQQYKDTMRALASAIDQMLNPPNEPKQTGFVLLMFGFGDIGERMNYISNGQREDVVKSLGELLARFKGEMKESDNIN